MINIMFSLLSLGGGTGWNGNNNLHFNAVNNIQMYTFNFSSLCSCRYPFVFHVAHVTLATAKIKVFLGFLWIVNALGLIADDIVGEASFHADTNRTGRIVIGRPQNKTICRFVRIGYFALDFVFFTVFGSGSIIAFTFNRFRKDNRRPNDGGHCEMGKHYTIKPLQRLSALVIRYPFFYLTYLMKMTIK